MISPELYDAVIFLTANAFGVLPPIAKLTNEQAQYHFISGYTSKIAGTERGIVEPQAAFSTCFGAPFMPRHPIDYANFLKDRIEKHQVNVYLINTGWQGGPYGVGKRVSIPYTRAMVKSALNGSLAKQEFWTHSIFNIQVPKACAGVANEILDPQESWTDKVAYEQAGNHLAQLFIENFKHFPTMKHLEVAAPKPIV